MSRRFLMVAIATLMIATSVSNTATAAEPAPLAVPADVALTEVRTLVAAGENGWIELRNIGVQNPVDISGWRLARCNVDGSTTTWAVFPTGTTIPAGGAFTVAAGLITLVTGNTVSPNFTTGTSVTVGSGEGLKLLRADDSWNVATRWPSWVGGMAVRAVSSSGGGMHCFVQSPAG